MLTTNHYGEILRFDPNSGKYFFSNPFFKAYSIMRFTTELNEKEKTEPDTKVDELTKYFLLLLSKQKGVNIEAFLSDKDTNHHSS